MRHARIGAISTLATVLLLAAALSGRQTLITTEGGLARDASGPPKGDGVVLGKTVDAATGKPIGGVVVTLNLMGGAQVGSYQPVLTDDQGRFVVRNLPKGSFRFYAVKPGYVPGAYSKRIPVGEANYFGQLMDLAEGERATNVTITLWKYAVIEGRVTDERGDPVVSTTVRVLPRRVVAGRSQFSMETSAIPFGTFNARTDDRGMYRLDSLPPGEYAVAVPVVTWSGPRARPVQSAAAAEAASQSSAGVGSWAGSRGSMNSASVDVGDPVFAMMEPTISVLSSLAGFTAEGRPLVYETQYFSGSTALGRATPVTLGSGETRSNVDFRLRPVPASRISGTAAGPNGPMPNLTLRLVSSDMSLTSGDPEIAVSTTDANGAFTFLGVTPGQYAIRALDVPRPPPSGRGLVAGPTVQGGNGGTVLFSTAGLSSPPIPEAPTLWADVPVSVADSDVADVRLTLQPGYRVSGRVEFDGAGTRPTGARPMSVSLVRADGQRGINYSMQQGRVDEQWRLTTYSQVPGQYVLQVALTAPNWYFNGAFVDGRDISIVPVDLTKDIDGVVIKISDKPLGSIAGLIRNARGQPDDTATVLVFPVERALWANHGPAPRNLKAVGSGRAGQYVADGLPAGDYFLIAVPDAVPEWADLKSLETLSRTAARVTVRDHERSTMDLSFSPRSGRSATTSIAPSNRFLIETARERGGHGPFVDDTQQPRDAVVTPATGTGRIAGIISTTADGRSPAPRARVTLTSAGNAGTRAVITNETGQFEFKGLPAGRYSLTASKAAYLGASYGATKPGVSGSTIVLGDGQQLADVVLTLSKGGVITGVIRDERGQPMPGATAQLLQYRALGNGERRLANTGASERTDDRGMYRIFGLAPGDYFLSASANYVTSNAHPTSAEDIAFALQPAPAGGRAAGSAAASPDRVKSMRYVPVLHPGTPTTEGAQVIKLGLSEERAGVDVTLRLVPAVSIEGTVVSSVGPLPPNVDVRLLSVGDAVPTSGIGDLSLQLPVRIGADGKFSFPGVSPGKYVLAATSGAAAVGGRDTAVPTSPGLWGSTAVEVTGIDLSSLTVSLQRGMTVSGMLRFESASTPPPADLSTIRVYLNPVLTSSEVAMGQTSATAGADGSFTFSGLTPGKYTLRAQLGTADVRSGWITKAVSASGRDVTDVPLQVNAGEDVTDAVLVFGDRPAEITGTLTDAAGKAATDCYVILMPSDPVRWRSINRRIQPARVSTDGQFAFRNLLAGDYLVAVARDFDQSTMSDPDVLTELSRKAVKITLAEGEKKVQPLTIGK